MRIDISARECSRAHELLIWGVQTFRFTKERSVKQSSLKISGVHERNFEFTFLLTQNFDSPHSFLIWRVIEGRSKNTENQKLSAFSDLQCELAGMHFRLLFVGLVVEVEPNQR